MFLFWVYIALKLCEINLFKVLLWNCNSMWLRICCVLISVSITNWFIRALNQFISLLYPISLAPRFIKIFQITKTIFKGLNWIKIFQSSIHPPSWTQPKTFSKMIVTFAINNIIHLLVEAKHDEGNLFFSFQKKNQKHKNV